MTDAMSVADYIILKATKIGDSISNLQLQRIMYFLNVIALLNDDELVSDNKFEKWDYGPVIHEVYSEYSANGANTINEPCKHTIVGFENGEFEITKESFSLGNIPDNKKKIIDNNLSTFLRYDPFQLVNFSHKEPQWKDRSMLTYSKKETLNFYRKKENRFWEAA